MEASGHRGDFLAADGTPILRRCAVLFVDLLGVSAMATEAAKASEHLVALDRALRGAVRDFIAEDSPWPTALLSDSMVIAAPGGERFDDQWILNELLVQGAILQLQLCAQGFFVRGGLTIGDLHIHDRLVFGPALVRGYELERAVAKNPRIVLGEEASAILEADLADYAEPAQSTQGGLLLFDQDGVPFVDYLGMLTDEFEPYTGLRIHREVVEAKLAAHLGDVRIWEKYRWVAEYHNDFRRRWDFPNDYEIASEKITTRFAPFAAPGPDAQASG